MLVSELIAQLQKFQPTQEVVVVPPPEHGDAEYQIIGINAWDIGKEPGVCAISISGPEHEESNPDQIANKMDTMDLSSMDEPTY